MSLLPLFAWLDHSAAGRFMQGFTYAFASVEVIHLFGLALFGGGTLILGLRVLGFFLLEQPVGALVRGLYPMLLIGLVALILSGIFLVADGPLRYYANPAFRVKMVLLLVSIALGVFVYRNLSRTGSTDVSRRLRVATALSVLLWLGVGLAGRAIGLL